MKARFAMILALAICAAPAFAGKAYIDYDKEYDKKIETYAWYETSETSMADGSPLMHQRIIEDIETYLIRGRGQRVESDPDVYFTYHTDSKETVSVNTSSYGYGYPSAWSMGGYYGRYGGYGYGGYGSMGSSSTTVSTYETGTLIIDVWDAETEKLIWRGTAAGITVSDNPNKMAKRITKAIRKIVAQWDRTKASDDKKAAKAG